VVAVLPFSLSMEGDFVSAEERVSCEEIGGLYKCVNGQNIPVNQGGRDRRSALQGRVHCKEELRGGK
jgi:hypothetical protein